MLVVPGGCWLVALRKESVDRNAANAVDQILPGHVALRKESVDRNINLLCINCLTHTSLSARRAWIEIAVIRRAVWAY